MSDIPSTSSFATSQSVASASGAAAASNQTSNQGGTSNNSITSISYMDDLIKEYLIFRGFNSTFKSFEHEIKQDKDRCFKADKITEQLMSYIHNYDLFGLLDYWTYLDNKFFSRLTFKTFTNYGSLSRKYELFLLRYYLVNAIQTSKTEKAIELFENYAIKLQSQVEWKEWYCLPFIKNPEDNPTFAMYFNKNWIDTFIISLQNFLNIVFQSVPFPRLLCYEEDFFWQKQSSHNRSGTISNNISSFAQFEQEYLQNELIDEFQLIQTDVQNKQGTLMSLLKNLTSSSKNKPPQNVPGNVKPPTPTPQNLSLASQLPTITKLIGFKPNPTAPGSQNQPKSDVDVKNPNTETTKSKETIKSVSSSSDLLTTQTESIENLISQIKLEPKPPSESTISSLSVESYLNLSSEDYLQHKSPILHCKFSNDGKYIVSVDVHGIIKIWSIDNPIKTVNTLIQKCFVTAIEWDAINSNILYIGTKPYSIKIYDMTQKKIINETNLNKSFPIICLIKSFLFTSKILIFSASKLAMKKDTLIRSGHVCLADYNSKNNNIVLEKFFELENWFCQSCIGLESNIALLGCSDGTLRNYEIGCNFISNAEKLHKTSVLNMQFLKTTKLLISLSTENIFIIKLTTSTKETIKYEKISEIALGKPSNMPVYSLELLIGYTSSYLMQTLPQIDVNDIKSMINTSKFIVVDNIENNCLLLQKSGVHIESLNQLKEAQKFPSTQPNADTNECHFSLENATTFDFWNSGSNLSILLVGSLNGTIRIFKLLNQF